MSEQMNLNASVGSYVASPNDETVKVNILPDVIIDEDDMMMMNGKVR